jgi:hypothetical protein
LENGDPIPTGGAGELTFPEGTGGPELDELVFGGGGR